MQLASHGQRRTHARLLTAAILLVAALTCVRSSAHARDLLKSDPERKLILDSARGQDNVKLIVKDLYKDGDFAVLCALKQEPGGAVVGTDEMLDVYEWVLIRDNGRWNAHELGAGFAPNVSTVSCSSGEQSGSEGPRIKSKADIIDALLSQVRWELLQDMAGRHSIDDHVPVFELLKRKGLDTGIPMDEPKVLHKFRVSLLSQKCKSARCKAENRRSFARIESLRKSDHVNALAWTICDRTASRTGDIAAFERCLKTAAAEPACRTGLRLPQDQHILEQCAATLAN